jgi:dihydrofolate reductase
MAEAGLPTRRQEEGTMRKIIVHEFITLDGVIQAPGAPDEDTDGGFLHGGWTLPYWHDDIGAHFDRAMKQADTLLLGRRTWQTHGGAFEPMTPGDPFGDAMNAKRKVVVSTTLPSADAWRNSTLISRNVIDEVRKLKAGAGKDILIDGSSVLIHALVEHNLIDEFWLHLYPVVLGGGKRLFPAGKRVNLELRQAERIPTGVIFQEFKVAE